MESSNGVLTPLGSLLQTFRATGAGGTQNLAIATVDQTIQAMENAIVPTAAATGTTTQNYPVDQAGITQQLMNQIFAQLLEMGSPPGSTYSAAHNFLGITYYAVDSTGVLNVTGSTGTLADDFSNLDSNPANSATSTSMFQYLNSTGQSILANYYNLIQATFKQGATVANNPSDPAAAAGTVSVTNSSTSSNTVTVASIPSSLLVGATLLGQTVISINAANNTLTLSGNASANVSSATNESYTAGSLITGVATQIPIRTINGVDYGYVTVINGQTFLVPVGITLQSVTKQPVKNALSFLDGATSQQSQVGYTVGFSDASAADNVTLLPVDSTTFQPTGGATFSGNVRFMDAIVYTYFWNEARVAVMKGKLTYQQDVVQQLQNALQAANAASTDLEQQAGLTEQQDSTGKPDPNASKETASLNMFVAIASKAGSVMFNTVGANPTTGDPSSGQNPYYFNYSLWTSNRVALKNYTDNLNSQAQNAMLDYQQTLNNYNNAYDVMGKLQDKFNTMFQAQLPHIAGQ